MTASVVISDLFQKSCDQLDGSLKARVLDFIMKLQRDPDATGLDLKMPAGVRDRRVRTARVNDNFRAVLFELPEGYILAAVKPHDAAYAYAARLQFEVNAATGAAEIQDQVAPVRVSAESRDSKDRWDRIRRFIVPGLGIAALLAGSALGVLAISSRPAFIHWGAIFVAVSGILTAIFMAISRSVSPFSLHRIVTVLGPTLSTAAALASILLPPVRPALFFGGCVTLIVAPMPFLFAGRHSPFSTVLATRAVGSSFIIAAIGAIAVSLTHLAVSPYLFFGAVCIILGTFILGSLIYYGRSVGLNRRIPRAYQQDRLHAGTAIVSAEASREYEDDLTALALENLRGIRFQQSFSVDRSQGFTVSAQSIIDYEMDRKIGCIVES